jgi:formylmethanofuran dehydrogenase subunit C
MISLQPQKELRFPATAECINPDVFESKTLEEIEALEVWEGNKQKKLIELFRIEEVKAENEPENPAVTINGDISHVRRVGLGMKRGEMTINGDAGSHLGEEMKGGKITVHGNAGGWVGSMMVGGIIEIHGNAGDYLGAPYRGSTKGMQGGRVIVHGNVGNEAGAHMKKGIIKIYGSAGQFVGFRMLDGTIYVQGDCEGRAGACMVDGKIVVRGRLESVLPTFTIDSVRPKVRIGESEEAEGPLYVFLGDLAENGNGKLYVSKEKNPHLNYYEKFL